MKTTEKQTSPEIESLVFQSTEPDRGYTVRAHYLKPPHDADALIEIFKDGKPLSDFRFPAYKVWNIAAHFKDIVDGEIAQSARGYAMAASNGIEGMVFIVPDAKATGGAR